jgi:hypothetical protein
MRRAVCAAVLAAVGFVSLPAPVAAQTAGTASAVAPEAIQFPQWSRDLRRAEIIAFGTLPFTWLISTMTMDFIRTGQNGGDRQYWPWPLKPSGAPAMTNDEYISAIGIAAGLSVGVAIVDSFLIRAKRKAAAKSLTDNPAREPDIKRRPLTNPNAPPAAVRTTAGRTSASQPTGTSQPTGQAAPTETPLPAGASPR